MSDWIGTPTPPVTSAPPWPRAWRIWWDPKAPHGSGEPSEAPTIDPFPPVLPENPPTVTGTGSPGCQIWITFSPTLSGANGWVMVDPDGTWSYTPPVEFPPGEYCAQAKQRCTDVEETVVFTWSPPVEECFTVEAIDQIVDFEAKHLRFESVNGWPVYGTMAYRINGTWVYGVLRRAVEVPNG